MNSGIDDLIQCYAIKLISYRRSFILQVVHGCLKVMLCIQLSYNISPTISENNIKSLCSYVQRYPCVTQIITVLIVPMFRLYLLLKVELLVIVGQLHISEQEIHSTHTARQANSEFISVAHISSLVISCWSVILFVLSRNMVAHSEG